MEKQPIGIELVKRKIVSEGDMIEVYIMEEIKR